MPSGTPLNNSSGKKSPSARSRKNQDLPTSPCVWPFPLKLIYSEKPVKEYKPNAKEKLERASDVGEALF